MKFNLTLEYSEAEYISATTSWTKLAGVLVEKMAKRSTEPVFEAETAPTQEAEKEAATIPFTRPLGPVEVSPPAEVHTDVEAKSARKKVKQVKKGEVAFSDFIREWLAGINVDTMDLIPDVKQPDRDLLLRSYANSPNAYPILLFVNSCGGLQQAVAKVTNSERLGLDLTRFIVPPASIAFPDLADLYEYSNPFNKDEEEE
jgi:hypothetical protein